jgi:DNA-directed RNA polymerase subunit RPC12/RpoP
MTAAAPLTPHSRTARKRRSVWPMVRNFHFSRKTAVPSTPSISSTQTLHTRVSSAHVGGCSRGSVVPEERDVSFFEAGAKLPESSSPGGKPFDHSKARVRAAARWNRQKALRADPMHCSHCGRIHDKQATGYQQCPECRDTAKRHRRKTRSTILEVGRGELRRLEKRIAAMENYCANLRALQKIEYRRGYVAGRRLHRRAAESQSYRDAMEARGSVCFEDLQQFSHAYAR